MTENLTKYLPLALRAGGNEEFALSCIDKKSLSQNQTTDSDQKCFLVSSRFSLRLDEIA
jgi:hypothetical protein